MSIQAVGAVLDLDVGEVYAKMLLVCIANAHNTGTGLCCPSIDRLALEAGMSRRSVQRWLAWLATDDGGSRRRFIEVSERYAASGCQQASDIRLLFLGGEGVTLTPSEGDTADTPRKNRKKDSNPQTPFDLSDAFSEVMAAWPRFEEAHRGSSIDLFEALPDAEKAQAIAAARRYPAECRAEAARRGRSLDQHVPYTKTLPKWIAEKKWLGSEAAAALASPAAKRIAAGADVVVRNRGEGATPALFAACLELMGPSWAWKSDWAEAIFPKDVVDRARSDGRSSTPGGGSRLSA